MMALHPLAEFPLVLTATCTPEGSNQLKQTINRLCFITGIKGPRVQVRCPGAHASVAISEAL